MSNLRTIFNRLATHANQPAAAPNPTNMNYVPGPGLQGGPTTCLVRAQRIFQSLLTLYILELSDTPCERRPPVLLKAVCTFTLWTGVRTIDFNHKSIRLMDLAFTDHRPKHHQTKVSLHT